MSDSQDCWAKLRELAEAGSEDPCNAAANIVRNFAGKATQDDVRLLRVRLEDTLLAGKYTEVPSAYLEQHSRWLAVLEGACAGARQG